MKFEELLDQSIQYGDSQAVCFEKGYQARQDEVNHLQREIANYKEIYGQLEAERDKLKATSMVQWVESFTQPFPDEAQQHENHKRNNCNEYLAVIFEPNKVIRSMRISTVPVNLWIDTETGTYYWTHVADTDSRVTPVKWAMMPKPERIP